MVLLLFIHCLLLLPLFVGGSVFGVYFVLQYFVSFLILQSSRGEERAGCFTTSCCVLNVMSLLSFFDSSSRCHGLICSI